MKKLMGFLMGSLLVVSCAEKVVEEPENLIPKEKMASILHDLAILNATKSAASNKFEEADIDIMEFLYRRYDIDSTQFAQSDLYYASQPLEYQSIYESVEAKLDKQAKIMEERAKKKNDSIRKASERKRDSLKIKERKDSIPAEP